jgi:glycosyltransferase involved in cell wall biosynthesis
VNQTKLNEDLVSDVEGIRVINSREFGLSKSRNLAIENATGDILVIADDDIEYLPGFDKTILKAYETYPEASLISFQFLDEKGKLAKLYPRYTGYISSNKRPLSSVEISIRREDIIQNEIWFDKRFGLGTSLPCSEEQLFKQDIIIQGLKAAYIDQPILSHKGKTSSSDMGKPELVRATTAYKFLMYKHWTYLWLMKYVFFLYRHTYISFLGQIRAYKYGIRGISELKKSSK